MLCLCDVVHICNQRCLGSDNLRNSGLASGVGMAVEMRKHQCQVTSILHHIGIIIAV